ncbi:hypothetical protein F67_I3_11_009 [Rhizobium phage RHph_I3_11]|nr:hypothetical protein F67_I3_11_009 [Rhizobium phage RHph_I3_11]
MLKVELKTVEIAIVLPVKGKPGKRVGTLVRRVPSEMSLPEIIKEVRHDMKDETEGVIFLDNTSFNQTLADFKRKQEEKQAA